MNLNDALKVYAITDRHWLNGRTLVQVVEESLQGGVTMLQLREKELEYDSFLSEAHALKALCAQYQVPFLINDNVDIAVACDADGVHVGQSDEDCAAARAKLGPNKIIGVSAQTVEQALAAEKSGADYLGVGAVFPTDTKADAACVSNETLREICNAVSIPVVAIGGITLENAPSLAGTGIAGLSIISAIYGAPDIKEAAEEMAKAEEQAAK